MSSQSGTANDARRLGGLAAFGAAQAIIYGVLVTWQGYHDRPGLALILILTVFAFYLAALGIAGSLSGRAAFAIALVLGLSFRALLLPEPPFLSDDYFRYLWDGLVQLRGINPYRYAPADPALAGLGDALRAQVNHPEVRTIYPPLAQLAFVLAALISAGSVIVLKSIWLACDLAIAALLFHLVPKERRLQAWMLYWWSPLVIIEVAWNAHLDLLGVLPIVAALYLVRKAPIRSAGLGLGIATAVLVKYFALVFLPAAARSAKRSRVLAAFAAAIVLLHIPYARAGTLLFDGLATYASSWRFNGGVFEMLMWLVMSPLIARSIAAAAVVLLVVQSVRNEWTLERTVFWLTGAIVVLSPTVHPWYLLWMVPLVALRPNRAWLYLTGAIFLAYYGLGTYIEAGYWPEPWWIRLTIYGPFFLVLVTDAWRGSWWQAAWAALSIRPPPR